MSELNLQTALTRKHRLGILTKFETGEWELKTLIGSESDPEPWTPCINVVNWQSKYLGKLHPHQAIWLLGRGPVTCGCSISHLCASTNKGPISACINLHHMTLQPIGDNTRRNKEQWQLIKYWKSHLTKEKFAAGPLFMKDIDGESPIRPNSSFFNCVQIGSRIKGLHWYHRDLTVDHDLYMKLF